MSRELCIRSARDGVTLTLSNFVCEGADSMSDSFLVEVKAYDLRAEARASTFMAADLGQFFTSLANDWRGWQGERTWATLEGEFELTATSDPLGHVRLAYFIRPPHTGFNWELRGVLELEAGQLESLSLDAQAAWNSNAS
jgi:hypothetical protein